MTVLLHLCVLMTVLGLSSEFSPFCRFLIYFVCAMFGLLCIFRVSMDNNGLLCSLYSESACCGLVGVSCGVAFVRCRVVTAAFAVMGY